MFTVNSNINQTPAYELILTDGKEIRKVFGSSKRKTKGNLLKNMKLNGPEICKIMDEKIGQECDFEFNYCGKTKAFIFSNGFFFKYGERVKLAA